MKKSLLILVFALSFICPSTVGAKVWVSTAGTSDGDSLLSNKPAQTINKLSTTSANGGSILIATARSLFTKKRIIHGNKVVSKGTGGDAELTHVNANSIFAGTATFHSDDGEPVDDFTIDLGLHGTLKCKAGEDVPQFYSLAEMAVE